MATIFTDSRVSLDSLKNPKNHAFLVENIRKKVASLENNEWKIKFSWVKAHVGIYGNELAYILAKEAARSDSTNCEYNRIPKSAILKKQQKKPYKNGRKTGQHHLKLQQQDNIFHQFGID